MSDDQKTANVDLDDLVRRIAILENHRDQHRDLVRQAVKESEEIWKRIRQIEQDQLRHSDRVNRIEVARRTASEDFAETEPERYSRINIKQNAKGEFQGETTIALTMRGSSGEFQRELLDLHKIARVELAGEIEFRRAHDPAAANE